jgi:NitT/TauT family transport system substrate-binding protein
MSVVPYGVDQGIFEKHGLDVTIETGQGGAAMLPALQSGQMDFVVGNAANLLQAVDQGLDMRVVSGYGKSLAEGRDVNAVLALEETGVDSWSDLEGKSVAVNALRGQGDLTIMASVEADGGDPAAVDFVEIAFPDMQAQLEAGNVDAMWTPDPFLHTAENTEGIETVGYPNQIIPGLPVVVNITTGQLAESDPELVGQYEAAIAESLEAFANDPDGAKQAIMDYIDISDEAAELSFIPEEYDSTMPVEQLQELSDLMTKYGYVEENPITEEFFIE